jgi:Abortive infection C-terminus
VSTLTGLEKLKLSSALDMGGGFVLGFSNQTFAEFFLDFFGLDIYAAKYDYSSGSKANRMRAFWNQESDYLVGQVLGAIFDNWQEFKGYGASDEPPKDCVQIARRLRESAPPPDLMALVPTGDDKSFDTLARSVRESIERSEPEAGLDRLHTFVVKYFRLLCEKRGIDTPRDKPLHSLVGEYVKALRTAGEIESEMTERILKSSISVLDSFNAVRNDRSLAHDNEMLTPEEALLILSYVSSLVRFIQSIEVRSSQATAPAPDYDDIPF